MIRILVAGLIAGALILLSCLAMGLRGHAFRAAETERADPVLAVPADPTTRAAPTSAPHELAPTAAAPVARIPAEFAGDDAPKGPLVTGSVRDLRGRQVSDAPLFLVASDFSWRIGARTDAAGAFTFESRPGEQILTVPGAGGFETARRTLTVAARDVRIEVVLQKRTTLRFAGRIVDADGCALEGPVRGTVECHDGSGEIHPLRSDRAGHFEVAGTPRGRIVVRTTDPIRTEATFDLRSGEADRMELRLDSGRNTYKGRLLSRGGSPISDASIHLERTFEVAKGVRARSFRTAYSDDRGEFSFEGLGAAAGSLTIMASGFTTRLADVPGRNLSTHVIRLDPVDATPEGTR